MNKDETEWTRIFGPTKKSLKKNLSTNKMNHKKWNTKDSNNNKKDTNRVQKKIWNTKKANNNTK